MLVLPWEVSESASSPRTLEGKISTHHRRLQRARGCCWCWQGEGCGSRPLDAGSAWRCLAIASRLSGSGTTGNWSSKIFPSSLRPIYMFIMEVFKPLMRRNAHCGEMIKAETAVIADNNKGMLITSEEAGGQCSRSGAVPCPVTGADLVPWPCTDVLTHGLQTSAKSTELQLGADRNKAKEKKKPQINKNPSPPSCSLQ